MVWLSSAGPRIDKARIVLAREIIRPGATGEGQREAVHFRLDPAGRQYAFGCVPARSHQADTIAVTNQSARTLLIAEIEFRIAQHGSVRTVSRAARENVEGEFILTRINRSSPPRRTKSLENER